MIKKRIFVSLPTVLICMLLLSMSVDVGSHTIVYAVETEPYSKEVGYPSNQGISTAEAIKEAEEEDVSTAVETASLVAESLTVKMSDISESSKLNSQNGVNYGPSGKETYYNLNMDGVVWIMRNKGFSEEEYPYWVREDGVKMLGDYVMVAADLSLRPRGSLVECSLGTAIVCDTGNFIYENPYQLDVAVDW